MHISTFDTVNGDGIRAVLWVAGCEHRCSGCHNPETWESNAGERFTESTLKLLLETIRPSYVAGLTLSGGDPLHPNNVSDILNIVKKVRAEYPDKTIWLYTGYYKDDIPDSGDYNSILENIDVLVDGPFVLSEKTLNKAFVGSANQTIYDLTGKRNSNG